MEFIYRLQLIDNLINEENWTDEQKLIVKEHFSKLLELKEEGTLLLAGKTAGQDKNTFGIVLFKADSFKKASEIMKRDPAVAKGIMTATLFEFNTAIFNNSYKND